jgi:hypothetical protein
MEFGKPINKNGYTTVPLYDTTRIDAYKDSFLESMHDAGLPNDLSEWIYNEYINVKRPVTFQTPSMKIPFGNIETTSTVDGKKQYSLSLNFDLNSKQQNNSKFDNMFKAFEDHFSKTF